MMKRISKKVKPRVEEENTLARDLALSPSPGWEQIRDGYQGMRLVCKVSGCAQAGRRFLSTFNIRRHWALTHKAQVKRFCCPERECTTTFGTLADGRKHLRNQHQRSWDKAGQTFFTHQMVSNTTYVSPKGKRSPPPRGMKSTPKFGQEEETPVDPHRVKSVVHRVKMGYGLDSSDGEEPPIKVRRHQQLSRKGRSPMTTKSVPLTPLSTPGSATFSIENGWSPTEAEMMAARSEDEAVVVIKTPLRHPDRVIQLLTTKNNKSPEKQPELAAPSDTPNQSATPCQPEKTGESGAPSQAEAPPPSKVTPDREAPPVFLTEPVTTKESGAPSPSEIPPPSEATPEIETTSLGNSQVANSVQPTLPLSSQPWRNIPLEPVKTAGLTLKACKEKLMTAKNLKATAEQDINKWAEAVQVCELESWKTRYVQCLAALEEERAKHLETEEKLAQCQVALDEAKQKRTEREAKAKQNPLKKFAQMLLKMPEILDLEEEEE